ncbi:hypothetical protein MO973_18195 [Paenibacillus sp. TRM 82003]|nr:hypothetical protein [Paenibacillus sp. TRM 82003]
MKPLHVTKGVAGVLATLLLLPTGLSASAASESAVPPPAASSTPAASVNYGIAQDIRAAVKNASITSEENGSRISVTLRLYNGGIRSTRVPEHELRVQTEEGLTYTLTPSTTNKGALQPREIVELVYSSFVDVNNIGALRHIDFVNVNLFVYPKVEKTLLSLPAESVWYGLSADAPAKPQQAGWGQSFRIPGINSGIVFTPVNASTQSTSSGKAVVVTLLAANPGKFRETIPTFRIDGVEGQKLYPGQSSQVAPKELEGGEEAYVHFVVPVDQGVNVTGLLVQSTDSFAGRNGSITISTGKLTLPWPTAKTSADHVSNYALGQPIAIDTLTKIVDAQTEIALMEFDIHENAEEGHKTAIAKFKMTNRSNAPIQAPLFGTEITNSEGVSYRGARQKNAEVTMNPGLSYVVSYSYVIPRNEESGRYSMKLLDQAAVAPYSTQVASVMVQEQETQEDAAFSLYPYTVEVNDVQVGYTYNTGLYQFKFTLDLNINQLDNVVVDSNFSKLRFEVVDAAGRIIGTQDAALSGPKKLISGKQVLEATTLNADQFNYPFTVNLYEVFETETGMAQRFLKRVK